MLKLRLKRCGRKRQPSYRIVVMENRTKRDGAAIEELGFYNPISKKFKIRQHLCFYSIFRGLITGIDLSIVI